LANHAVGVRKQILVRKMALFEPLLLDGVFAAQVFEVLDVLLIDLFEDTLQIFSARPLQVSVEFSLLFGRQ